MLMMMPFICSYRNKNDSKTVATQTESHSDGEHPGSTKWVQENDNRIAVTHNNIKDIKNDTKAVAQMERNDIKAVAHTSLLGSEGPR